VAINCRVTASGVSGSFVTTTNPRSVKSFRWCFLSRSSGLHLVKRVCFVLNFKTMKSTDAIWKF
jgi:hypothetical protein